MLIGGRGGRAVVATFALAVLAISAQRSPATAAAPDAAGYWWRFQVAAGSPLAPPGVEPGELYVAADPVGPSAVAATRFTVPAGTAPTELRLAVAATVGEPSVSACPTSGWTPPEGAGPFEDRPTDEACATTAAAGAISADGKAWTLPLASLVRDGVVDVLLIPGAGTHSITFARPDAGAMVTAALPATAPPPQSPLPPTGAIGLPSPASPVFDDFRSQVVDAPSSGLAVAPSGTPAAGFDSDVVALPAPLAAGNRGGGPTPDLPQGARSPLALLAVLLVAGAWILRTRQALAAAESHPFAQPLRAKLGVLEAEPERPA